MVLIGRNLLAVHQLAKHAVVFSFHDNLNRAIRNFCKTVPFRSPRVAYHDCVFNFSCRSAYVFQDINRAAVLMN
jgi:hypothetical protein